MVTVRVSSKDKERLLSWIQDKESKFDDLRPVLNEMKPIAAKTVGREFSSKNPNAWSPLSPAYVKEKTEAGYPATIGVRTGGLKWAATTGAMITIDKRGLTWRVDMGHVNSEGERVGDYAGDFNSTREIFIYTRRYLVRLKNAVVQAIVDKVMK